MHSCIYKGRVNHCRYAPRMHRFGYTLFMMYIDLEELPALFDGCPGWAVEKPALASFRSKDHYSNGGGNIQDSIRRLVAESTGDKLKGAIRLLTHLRYFGYIFNPLSLYFCFDEHDEKLTHVVAEVTNTPWKQRHCYVLAGRCENNLFITPRHKKTLHVSPFMGMDMDYDWQIQAPGRRMSVKIDSCRAGEKVFDASIDMQRQALNQKNLTRILLAFPFMTLKVTGAIYIEALKLWLKRVACFPHPENH